jgi:hypothetical protein
MNTTKLAWVRAMGVTGALGVLALVVGCTNGSGSPTGSTSSASSTCSGWAQTSQCSASGPREPQNDKPCGEDLDPGWSGYCQCGGGDVGMNCGHVVISCDEACVVAATSAGSCIGWKQTSDCSAIGPREPQNDKSCSTTLDSGWSGYCECGQKVVQLDCGHAAITCDQACAQ